ncbi:murein DD-endopeptidase MepM/ murein hydrolase activator NlpD [Sphingomonas naasensis]|uniref:M23 family metallopeptidase n=1 Tax=Sphingomonas naasensis TaxID=1344951 RepID=A0A4S1W882_9SPHN|nr:M23 family metallopeptidase [Sphingomonas naasensis]NIJ20020.1 murein DD-endopeptidase MepM/ murein hydrolase activator NlpD [Sphingomonas naasensis]TGX37965.1 M23 family metallopeptidase [Sphingomonas naasensis]
MLASPPDAGQAAPGITPELPGPELPGPELPGGAGAAFRPSRAEPTPTPTPLVAAAPAAAHPRAALPRLSSRFGRRGDPIRGTVATHYGIDIPGMLGTPVFAAAPGTVRYAGTAGSYGNMVEIAHGGALDTRYAHLSRILVRPGAHVEQGEPVALMGSTGRSTGSHLHFEVRVGGSAVDPLPWLERDAVLPPAPARAPVIAEPPHVSAFARARAAALQGRAL